MSERDLAAPIFVLSLKATGRERQAHQARIDAADHRWRTDHLNWRALSGFQ
jgi:hypothetical protein